MSYVHKCVIYVWLVRNKKFWRERETELSCFMILLLLSSYLEIMFTLPIHLQASHTNIHTIVIYTYKCAIDFVQGYTNNTGYVWFFVCRTYNDRNFSTYWVLNGDILLLFHEWCRLSHSTCHFIRELSTNVWTILFHIIYFI